MRGVSNKHCLLTFFIQTASFVLNFHTSGFQNCFAFILVVGMDPCHFEVLALSLHYIFHFATVCEKLDGFYLDFVYELLQNQLKGVFHTMLEMNFWWKAYFNRVVRGWKWAIT